MTTTDECFYNQIEESLDEAEKYAEEHAERMSQEEVFEKLRLLCK